MARGKTTKEEETERQAARRREKEATARAVLIDLTNTARRLEAETRVEGHVAKAIREEISWLIAEDEIYQRMAAELWQQVGQANATGCSVARDHCND